MIINQYVNQENIEEIHKKGFSIYEYLSVKELISTVQQDYLRVLLSIHYFFTATTVLIGSLSYYFQYYNLFLYYILGTYGLIFLYVLARLIQRTYIFFLIRNIVYTHEGLIIGKNIFYYKDEVQLSEKLDLYADLFKEYLSDDSMLDKDISKKKLRIFATLKQNFKSLGNIAEYLEFLDKFIFVIFAFFAIHAVLLVIFYFVGLVIGYIFFGLYGSIIKGILLFSNSKSLAIKNEVSNIDEHLNILETIYQELQSKMSNFTDGEISNISNFIAQNFTNFYTTIDFILQKQIYLKSIIANSKYSNFIDFSMFSEYLRVAFNRPVNEMINLLKHSESNTAFQLETIKNLQMNTDELNNEQLRLKYVQLEMIMNQIRENKNRLEQSLL